MAVQIEVRCKGLFAYLKGKNGARWLAIPKVPDSEPIHDEHTMQLWVRAGLVAQSQQFTTVDPQGGESVPGMVRFRPTVKGLTIVGAKAAPPKDGATSPIPSNGLPNGPVNNDDSWVSQGFIANLRRLYPPQSEPILKVTETIFLMNLPRHTEWHGLAPMEPDMRTCTWDFVNQTTSEAVIPSQAITDRVGIPLLVPESTQLLIETDTSVVNVPVAFVGTSSPLLLIADPHDATIAKKDQPLKHFGHLYHMSSSRAQLEKVLPVRLCPEFGHAGDIFCPGGEGEGEGGG